MQAKKYVWAAVTAGAMSAGVLAGAGQAAADPQWWPAPPPPGHVGQVVNVPPGHIAQWVGVPPGHWDKPWKWFN